jgi:putative hemolysin
LEPSHTLFLLFVLMVCIVLSAFFSSSETAITGVDNIKLKTLVDQGNRRASLLNVLLEDPKLLITGILIGNNVANVAASAIATSLFISGLSQLALPDYLILVIATLVVTSVLLFFGEITPKSVALRNPTHYAMVIAPALRLSLKIMTPFIAIFAMLNRMVFRLLGVPANHDTPKISQAEVETIMRLAEEAGVLEQDETDMIHSIFGFGDTVAREIMTPRTDTVCIKLDASVKDAIELIIKHGHSRIPVYDKKMDNVVGTVYAKDLLKCNRRTAPVADYQRDALFIPETKDIESLFREMQQSKCHIAIVVNEHGGMAGIITLEDIIEEIFGEIQDEYDCDHTPDVYAISPHVYAADAKTSMSVLIEQFGLDLEESDDYDTLGGFVLHELGHFPAIDESFVFQHLKIKVKEMNQRRILKLEVTELSAHDPNASK